MEEYQLGRTPPGSHSASYQPSTSTLRLSGAVTASVQRPQGPLSPLKTATGPRGEVLTVFDLPRDRNVRWSKRRKAEVVLAIQAGIISADEACNRYALTVEELAGWQQSYWVRGMAGLRLKAQTIKVSVENGKSSKMSSGLRLSDSFAPSATLISQARPRAANPLDQ